MRKVGALALIPLLALTGCASSGTKPPKGPAPEEDPRILMQLGDSALSRQEYAQAIAYYTKSLAKDPKQSLVHNNLGLCYLASDKNADAESEFRKALEINADFADARTNLGTALARQDKREEAKAEFRKAADTPTYLKIQTPLYNLAKLQYEDGQYAEAAENFQKAWDRGQNFLPACQGLGMALQQLGRLREASSQLDKCTKTFPGDCQSFYLLGVCNYEQRRAVDAASQFDKVIELCPGTDPANKANEYLKRLREH